MSPVKLHVDSVSARAADRVAANAFTVGDNVFFDQGAYAPESPRGLRRIGHELAHVVQQRSGLRSENLVGAGERYEREADDAAAAFIAGRRANLSTGPVAGLPTSGVTGATPLQKEKKKKGESPVEPSISASVGIGCENLPEDVATVRGMLGLSADGGADQVLFDAIMTFQEGIDSINPDGRIELPRADEKGKRGTTWKELFKSITGHYPSLKEADGGPGSAKSANGKGGESLRPIFPRAQSVIFSGDEKAVYVDPKEPNAKHYDGDGDTLDDTATNMWKAANAAPGYALHKINNVEAATNVLKDYYSSQVSIDTMVVSSHGYREVNNFYVGSTQINAGNVKKLLAPWKPLLNDHTEVIVKACNTGGGTHPEKGKRFTQEIAETLGVTVYTSRSWAVSKTDSFADQPASWYGDPGSFDREDVRKYEDPYQNMGLWLKAMPEKLAQRRATELAEYSREHGMQFDEDAFVRQAKSPQEVFSPILHEDGTFTISDERFPTLSVLDEYEFEHYEWPK